MNFEKKFEVFWQFFHDNGGYTVVLEGLRNTLIIAVLGLVIGIIIGTLIATARVVPKTNPLVKILDWIARLYVSFFRGTPIVVQHKFEIGAGCGCRFRLKLGRIHIRNYESRYSFR